MCSPWPIGVAVGAPRSDRAARRPRARQWRMRPEIAITGCARRGGRCTPGRRPGTVGPMAATALEGVRRWGAAALAVPAAYRLRVELALVAIGTGQTDRARALLAPVAAAATSPLLRADARTALARCAVEDAPREVMSELRNARAAWSEVTGSRRQPGTGRDRAGRGRGAPPGRPPRRLRGGGHRRAQPAPRPARERVDRDAVRLSLGRPHHRVDLGVARHRSGRRGAGRVRAAVRLARGTAAALPAAGSASADGGAGGGVRHGARGHGRRAGEGRAGRRRQRCPGSGGGEPVGAGRPAATARPGGRGECGHPAGRAGRAPGQAPGPAVPRGARRRHRARLGRARHRAADRVLPDHGNAGAIGRDPRDRLPVRGPRVGGIDAIAAHGLGAAGRRSRTGGARRHRRPRGAARRPVGSGRPAARRSDRHGAAPGRLGCGSPAERPTGATVVGSASATTLDESVAVGGCGGRATRERGAGDERRARSPEPAPPTTRAPRIRTPTARPRRPVGAHRRASWCPGHRFRPLPRYRPTPVISGSTGRGPVGRATRPSVTC